MTHQETPGHAPARRRAGWLIGAFVLLGVAAVAGLIWVLG